MDKTIIEDYLLEKGFRPHLTGFYYLVEAIDIYTPGIKLVDDLYVQIAKKYGSKASRVERAIRNAIQDAGIDRSNGEYIPWVWLIMSRKRRGMATQSAQLDQILEGGQA